MMLLETKIDEVNDGLRTDGWMDGWMQKKWR
jgi:hypothetical protein